VITPVLVFSSRYSSLNLFRMPLAAISNIMGTYQTVINDFSFEGKKDHPRISRQVKRRKHFLNGTDDADYAIEPAITHGNSVLFQVFTD